MIIVPISTDFAMGRGHNRAPPPTIRPCWARVPTMTKRTILEAKPAPQHRTPATKRTASPSLRENVAESLRTLGVALAPEALDAALSAAEKESLGHLEFLHRLLAGPAELKLQRALERRIYPAQSREHH